MLTVIANTENSKTIILPPEEMEKLGITEGEEVELIKDNGEIVLRTANKNQRTKRILEKTEEIIARRRSALLELAKGAEE
jgi:antitoxin component of MazEF toxin-antitoxin module